MGITSWPITKERFLLPKKFNLSIDATGIFYMAQPSSVIRQSYIYNLISKAHEVCLVFDGDVPLQKCSERFRRQSTRPAFTHYFRNNGEQDIIYAVAQVAKNPILIEREKSYGEGEHKVLRCDAWLNPNIPILCLVNDNDFFQFLIRVPVYTHGVAGETKHRSDYIQHHIPERTPQRRYFTCSSVKDYLYYKVDSRGVLDFWRDYSLEQRKRLVVKTTIYWGNDYCVALAPSVKWESLVQGVLTSEFPHTYSHLVDECIRTFEEIQQRNSKRTTQIATLSKGLAPEQLGTVQQIEDAIQEYLSRLIWTLVFILFNPDNPGEYSLQFDDGVMLKWDSFSARTPKVTPTINLVGHFTERRRYYDLKCVVK